MVLPTAWSCFPPLESTRESTHLKVMSPAAVYQPREVPSVGRCALTRRPIRGSEQRTTVFPEPLDCLMILHARRRRTFTAIGHAAYPNHCDILSRARLWRIVFEDRLGPMRPAI